jgi:hypothetical protein
VVESEVLFLIANFISNNAPILHAFQKRALREWDRAAAAALHDRGVNSLKAVEYLSRNSKNSDTVSNRGEAAAAGTRGGALTHYVARLSSTLMSSKRPKILKGFRTKET